MGRSLKGAAGGRGVQVRLAVPGFDIQEVLDLALTEAVSRHAVLTAQLLFRGSLAAALAAIDSPIHFGVYDGRVYEPLFTGTVDEVEICGSVLTVTAFGPSHARDEAVRTTSYGDAAAPTPVHQLAGIGRLLAGVGNATRLKQPVHQVTQYGVTDFGLLLRLADLHGLLVVAPAAGGIRLTDGRSGPRQTISADWILPGTERLRGRRAGAVAAECLTWDLTAGKTPAKPARPATPEPGGAGLLAKFVARLAAGTSRHQLFTGPAGPAASDAARATALTRARCGGLVRYAATLGYAGRGVGVGTRLRLKGHPLRDELLVISRRLTYQPGAGRPEEQLRNALECTPAAFPPVGAAGPLPGPVVPVLGRVVDVADPAGLARVKVHFPWQTEDPKAGLWSFCPQSFGGEAGECHAGAVDLPAVKDWVLCLADPQAFDAPVVLGSVYPGREGGKPPKRPAPARERVLFRTPGGVEFRVTDGGGQQAGVTLAILKGDGQPVCGFSLSADGTVSAFGETVLFKGSKSIRAKGKTQVNGSLNVIKE